VAETLNRIGFFKLPLALVRVDENMDENTQFLGR